METHFARYLEARQGDAISPGSQPQESPESRLLAAGFTRRLEFWCPPGEERALNLKDAIAALEAGEIRPPHLAWPGVHPDAVGASGREARTSLTDAPPASPYRAATPAGVGRAVG